MLGWEFPPVLTGGLGLACYGLFKALSKYVDLTVIIPKTDKDFQLDNVNIIGLNYVGLSSEQVELERRKNSMESFAKVTYVDADLSPYPSYKEFPVFLHAKPLKDLAQIRNLYSTNEAYGANIMEKVATYTDIVFEIAKTKQFDIIHAHDWITFPAAIRLKEATGKPLVLHVHSLETDRVGEGARNTVYDIELLAMQLADKIVPVSQFTKDCIVKHYGIDPEKISPVHNAIDPAAYKKVEKKIDDKIVAFVGRVTYQKGPEYLIDTAERLAKKVDNFKFVIAGQGDMLAKTIAKAAERGLSDKFIFTGFMAKDRINELLSMADVYFMPSVSEPFGLSALEAAQHDTPCVVSKQSGVSEILPDVLKADFWDVDRFANYIYALLHYEGIKEHLVEHTRTVIDKMTWDNSALKVVDIYKNLNYN